MGRAVDNKVFKIGLFCNEYPPRLHGGIGTFTRAFAEALADIGHDVTVVEFGQQAKIRIQNGVRVVTLRESRAPRLIAALLNRLRLFLWLNRAAKRGEVEIFEIPEYQGYLPFPGEPCPIVVRLHHAESHIDQVMSGTSRKKKIYWLEKLTLFFHRNWIGVSQYILDASKSFFGCSPRKSTVIYHPAPTIQWENIPKPSSVPLQYILFVGSVSERKGAIILARAATPLLERWPNLHLIFVGPETTCEGKPISYTIYQIVGEHLKPRVWFLGHQSRETTIAWMRSALAVALPSRVESFGIVILEAMQLGVPVVYTRSGPGPEFIIDGVDGLLVDPEDVNEVRYALERLITDPDFARRLGEAGRAKVTKFFTMERCIEETLLFYQTILGASKD